jgi:putative acetyltransferase
MPAQPNSDLSIVVADPLETAAQHLLTALDADLLQRYPSSSVHGIEIDQLRQPQTIFLLAYWQEHAVGCGALRQIDSTTAEMKRVYVDPAFRGRGIARQLIQRLEAFAVKSGYVRIWLETGTAQPEAVGLYESRGYHPIPAFGEYIGDPYSLCYEKVLAEPVG